MVIYIIIALVRLPPLCETAVLLTFLLRPGFLVLRSGHAAPLDTRRCRK